MVTGVLCILSGLFYVYTCLRNTRMYVQPPRVPFLQRKHGCFFEVDD